MAVFSVTCPECSATLKSGKPIPAGKSVTCPKCDVLFKVPATKSQAPSSVTTVEDDFDQVEIVDEVTAAKEMKAATAVKRRRPRQQFKKKSNPWPVILISLGGLLGLAALGVGGYFAFKFLTSSRSGDPVAYMPPNSPIMGGADIGRLMNEIPELSAMAGMLDAVPPLAKYKSETNIDFKSALDKIVVGIGGSPTQPTVTTVALTSKTPLNKDKLAAAFGAKAGTVGGRSVFQSGSNPYSQDVMMVPNSSLVAFYQGNPNNMDDAVRRGGSSNPSTNLNAMVQKASQAHVWIVMDFSAPGLRDIVASNPMMKGANQDSMNNLKSMGMWANIAGSDVEITIHALTIDANTAKTFSDEGQKQMSQAKNPIMQAMLAPLGNARGAIQELIDTGRYGTDGATVTFSARIKMSTLQPLLAQMGKMPMSFPGLPGGQPSDPRGGRTGGRGGSR